MKLRKRRCVKAGMDRISGLPQDVLHKILCFLSQKEAVQTSVLAKSWLHLWSTRPKLELLEYDFRRDDDHGKEKFMHVLNKTLQGYRDQNLGIDELRLWTSQESAVPLLEEWIPIVIRNMGVKKLKLGLCVNKLVNIVFQSESLRKLSLQGWNLDSNCSVVLLSHLQKLVLDDVYIADETFEKIMLGCPLIEYVKMKNCATLRSINVNTHNHLVHLKTLNLERVELTGESFFHSFSSKFPCLEELVLKSCSGRALKKINLSSRSLKRLVIEDTMMKDSNAAFDTPNIKEFLYEGHIPQSVSFTTTTTTSDDRWWVSKLHLRSYLESESDASSWFLKLHQLLGAVSQSEIFLYFTCHVSPNPKINIEEGDIVIDGGFDNKPVLVEHLKLDFKFHSYSSFSAFIKALFSVCRPRQIYRKRYTTAQEEIFGEEHKQVTEFLCKILCMVQREEEEDVISWERDVEEVGLFEAFGEDGDEEEEWHRVESCWLQHCAALLPNNPIDPHKLCFVLNWREIHSLTN